MKSPRLLRNNTAVLSYVCFNPLFRATRKVQKKLRKHMISRVRWVSVKALVSAV